MGIGEKQANRRALIQTVEACLKQTNDLTAGFTDVREANNKLAQQTCADVKRLDDRLDTVGKWIARLEKHETLTREIAHAAHVEWRRRLESLTFAERLRYFLTGRLPDVPLPTLTAFPHPEPEKATVIAAPDGAMPLRGYIPHTSMGPRVLP